MERAQARMLLQEYIHVRLKWCWITEISQTAQVGVALPENSPGPPFSRRPEHPPTGTLWAPICTARGPRYMHALRLDRHWEARK